MKIDGLMQSTNRLFLLFGLALATLALAVPACDMNAEHAEFVEEGQIVYPGKLDSATVTSGKNRVRMTLFLPPDPSLETARVFWNTGNDSTVVPLPDDRDSVSTIIDGLEEGARAFTVHTYDTEGNQSLEYTVTGRVYGETYGNSLLRWETNRVYFTSDTLYVQWNDPVPNQDVLGATVHYMSTSGAEDSLFIPAENKRATIANYDVEANDTFGYETLYSPSEETIDTFRTELPTMEQAPPVEYPKSDWAVTVTSQDSSEMAIAPENVTDYDPATFWRSSSKAGYPASVTVDAGTVIESARGFMVMEGVQQGLAEDSISVEVSTDGSTWTDVGEFNLPGEAGTPQYFSFADAGVDGAVRYLKIRALKGDANMAGFAEVGLYK
jgi:hypothetical protein